MKIHAFKVKSTHSDVPLEEVIKRLLALPLDGRTPNQDINCIRMEEASEFKKNQWFLVFSKISVIGPGRASLTEPSRDFDLDDDEGFAEETGVYFNSETKYMLSTYNHKGARANSIIQYLSDYARKMKISESKELLEFYLSHVLQKNAMDRLATSDVNRSFIMKIDRNLITKEDSEHFTFSEVLEEDFDMGSDEICLEFKLSPYSKGALRKNALMKMVEKFLLFTGEARPVKVLRVQSKTEDGAPDPIDFIKEKLEKDVILHLAQGSRRYDRNDMRRVLKETFDEWQRNGELP